MAYRLQQQELLAALIGANLESPAGFAFHTGRPVISNHLHHETRFRTPELLAEHGVRRALNVIMSGEGEAFGVLEVDSRNPGRFTETDVIFLQSVANLLGVGTAPAPPCAKARSRPGS